MSPRLDAALVPHSSILLSAALEDSFVDLRRGIENVRESLAGSRPGLVVVTCSELLSVGPFRLLASRGYEGNLGGGSVPETLYRFDGVDVELVRRLVRRLRMSGVDAEPGLYEPLDFGSAVALHHLFPKGETTVLPIAVPSGSLRSSFRFGSTLAELFTELGIDVFWLAAGALSHRISKEPELVREEGEGFDREILATIGAGLVDPLVELGPRTLSAVAADAGLCHLIPVIGFLGDGYQADVLAYGGVFGAGNAVVGFRRAGRRTRELELAAMIGGGSTGS